MFFYLNGRLVPEEEACISVLDRGLLYGDGIFETMRAYSGEVFRLRQHLQRLRRSAALIGLAIPMTDEQIAAAAHETLRLNCLEDAYLRITITRGTGPLGLDVSACKTPTFLIIARPLKLRSQQEYDAGVSLHISSVRRNLREALDPAIKSLNFLNNILAKADATAAGADDALMLNHDGHLTECTASNIFFVREGTLCTPSPQCGILEGITRNEVLLLAARAAVPVRQDAFTPQDILSAEEAFITNTTMEVMPVTRIGQTTLNPGPITETLRRLFRDLTPSGHA